MAGVPIVNLPYGYIEGFEQSFTFTASQFMTIQDGQCRDSTNTFDIVLPEAVTLWSGKQGVNGIDFPVGDLTQDMFLYIYVIADPIGLNVTATIASQSPTIPTLPGGYSIFRLIGYARTTFDSDNFYPFVVSGSSYERKYLINTGQIALAGDDSTDPLNVPLDVVVPPVDNTMVTLQIVITPDSDGDSCQVAYGGSTSISGVQVSGDKAAVAQSRMIDVMSSVIDDKATVTYFNTNADNSVDINVFGFTVYL